MLQEHPGHFWNLLIAGTAFRESPCTTPPPPHHCRFLVYFFRPCCVACRISVPRPGIESRPPPLAFNMEVAALLLARADTFKDTLSAGA